MRSRLTTRPRMSRMRGGCTSVSMVRATAGLCRRAASYGAFFAVHMTIADPFHVNPIGMDRGVPSLAT
jgi:uncharacterized membrane protein YedE/YeeE